MISRKSLLSKPFAALGTGSKGSLFLKARLKLALVYLALQFIILVTFSLVLYHSLVQGIRDNLENDAYTDANPAINLEQATDGLRATILMVDGGILVVVGVLSYFFAGWTLLPIKQALERQREFSADASHELRTPLTIMKTQSEVALENVNAHEDAFRSLTKSNLEEVDRMSALVEDLLELSRGDVEQTTYPMEPWMVADIVSSVAQKMQPLADRKNISLSVNVSDKSVVTGNVHALGRMLMNIVKNAIQHVPSGGSIAMSVESRDDKVKIKVTDTGVGILKKDLPHVFKRFYKADVSRSSHEGGAGLGLSIVQAISEAHGGSASIESEPNKGVVVTIELPKKVEA